MRQYRCGQEGTKASTRRDADATPDARRRCAPRRPRPRTRSGRAGRATRTHVSRSSRRNRSDGPRSHVTPARMRSCARCRSRAARDSRSIVSSSPSSRLDDGSARRRPLNVHRALQPVDSGLNQYPTALWLPAVTAGSTPWTARMRARAHQTDLVGTICESEDDLVQHRIVRPRFIKELGGSGGCHGDSPSSAAAGCVRRRCCCERG